MVKRIKKPMSIRKSKKEKRVEATREAAAAQRRQDV